MGWVRGPLRTRRAATEENQFVAVDLEAVGRQRLDFVRAPMNVERLVTGAAEEVVVMRTVGQLVPKPAARELHFR